MSKNNISDELIIETSARIANKVGLDNLSLKIIAEELNIKSPSLYNHISSLDEIKSQLMVYGWKQIEEKMIDSAVGVSGYEALKNMCNVFYGYATNNKGIFTAMLWYNKYESDEKENATTRLFNMLFKIMKSLNITDENIMLSSSLKCPKSNKPDKKVKSLTKVEQAKFVSFLENYTGQHNRNNYSNQLMIELLTGMRMGEINALTPECIDFEKGIIHVKSTVARGENYREFIKNGTKTDAGVRDVPMTKAIKPILRSALNNRVDNSLNLLFYDIQKDGIISTNQVNCFFKRVCEKCGIEKRGQHALRHTFATRCIEANIPAVVLKKWLGHTDIHITLDTYADVFDSMYNDSINKLDNYILNITV